MKFEFKQNNNLEFSVYPYECNIYYARKTISKEMFHNQNEFDFFCKLIAEDLFDFDKSPIHIKDCSILEQKTITTN